MKVSYAKIGESEIKQYITDKITLNLTDGTTSITMHVPLIRSITYLVHILNLRGRDVDILILFLSTCTFIKNKRAFGFLQRLSKKPIKSSFLFRICPHQQPAEQKRQLLL